METMWIYLYFDGVQEERVIFTEDEDFDIESNCPAGFEFSKKFEMLINGGHQLPCDRELTTQISF